MYTTRSSRANAIIILPCSCSLNSWVTFHQYFKAGKTCSLSHKQSHTRTYTLHDSMGAPIKEQTCYTQTIGILTWTCPKIDNYTLANPYIAVLFDNHMHTHDYVTVHELGMRTDCDIHICTYALAEANSVHYYTRVCGTIEPNSQLCISAVVRANSTRCFKKRIF